MTNLSGKTVVIVGLGESGIAAAELARRHGAEVVANDAASLEALSPRARALSGRGVRLEVGGHP